MKAIRAKRISWYFLFFLVFFPIILLNNAVYANEEAISLDKAHVDLTDLPSLQRGAELFMNYCSGCHSLKYIRYSTMAKDIGITDSKGHVLEQAVKTNLMFVGDKLVDTIQSSMTKEEGANWFGVAPPDLSLVARLRGADWLYTYLRSFYPDQKRPWGVNNRIFPDVAMPDVLFNVRARLLLEPSGQKKVAALMLDLVNFLYYAGEPTKLVRQGIGKWVLLFLGIFFVFAYLLKREYWKDVHLNPINYKGTGVI
jgi:ubiquinol-cytochrome c reductase cytochrome c1 subunit